MSPGNASSARRTNSMEVTTTRSREKQHIKMPSKESTTHPRNRRRKQREHATSRRQECRESGRSSISNPNEGTCDRSRESTSPTATGTGRGEKRRWGPKKEERTRIRSKRHDSQRSQDPVTPIRFQDKQAPHEGRTDKMKNRRQDPVTNDAITRSQTN